MVDVCGKGRDCCNVGAPVFIGVEIAGNIEPPTEAGATRTGIGIIGEIGLTMVGFCATWVGTDGVGITEVGLVGAGTTGVIGVIGLIGVTVVDWFTPNACFGSNIDGCSADSCGEEGGESGEVLGLTAGLTGRGIEGIEDAEGMGFTGGIIGVV